MLAKHKLLDLIEGSSWVRYLDCGSVNDMYSSSMLAFSGVGKKLILQALSHKSFPTGSEKRQETSECIMPLVEIKMPPLVKAKMQVSCTCKSNFIPS